MPSVANLPQHLCHMWIIDLTSARLMPAGYIRDVNVAQVTCRV